MVVTNKKIASAMPIKNNEDRPSRYNTKISAQNTSAEPVSCCNNINASGRPIMQPTIKNDLASVTFTLAALKYRASKRQVANLANSDGCNLKPAPTGIHDWLPPTFRPISNTSINNTIVITYMAGVSAEINLLSNNSITMAIIIDDIININCLP
jgi:hypothetical protein